MKGLKNKRKRTYTTAYVNQIDFKVKIQKVPLLFFILFRRDVDICFSFVSGCVPRAQRENFRRHFFLYLCQTLLSNDNSFFSFFFVKFVLNCDTFNLTHYLNEFPQNYIALALHPQKANIYDCTL